MNVAATSPQPFEDPAGTWNRRFSESGYLFGTEPNGWLVEHADVWQAGQRVLSIADGEGRNSVWLAQRGLTVDAFDISEVGVRKARDFGHRRKRAPRQAITAECREQYGDGSHHQKSSSKGREG